MNPATEDSVSARACALDDVVMRVSRVEYGERTIAVRVDVRQQAIEDKTYVDLSVEDAKWLARVVLRAAEELA